MKLLHSMRWRLQVWYGVLLAAVLGGFGITAHQLEANRQLRRTDEELRRRLPPLVESQRPVRGNRELREFRLSPRDAALFDAPGPDAGFYYVVWLRHSDQPVTHSPSAPRDVPQPKPGDTPTRQRGNLREVFLFPGPGDCVLAGRSVAADTASLRQVGWSLAAVGAAVLLAGLTVGAWLVSRALRPIEHISAAAEQIASGDLTRRIATPESESELGRLAAVLNSTFARLDAAFTQQSRFTADAAHELRTPVAVMLTQAQNGLETDCGHEEHREAFAASQRAAQRMRRLIESLLQLARLDAGQEPLRRNPCDLARPAADSVDLLRPLANARHIQIHSELNPAPCPGDPDRLAQVVTNLVTNAIEYNQDHGEIRLRTSPAEAPAPAGVTLTVWNTGPGIAATDLPQVFNRFHRGDKARSSAGHSGLGLAIARAIVTAHGGSIAVDSSPATGTTFTVTLPG